MEVIKMNTNTEEWGNIELPGLSDEELFKKNWTRVAINKERWSDPEFVKRREISLSEALQRPEVKQNTKIAQQKMRTDEFNKKHSQIMNELYKTKEWQQSVKTANSNPVRNKKIKDAHSRPVATPHGIFTSLGDTGKHFNLTSEGIRHRIKTQPDLWYYVDEGPKESNRYRVETSFGKFLSIGQCFRFAKENNLFDAEKLSDGVKWFNKMLKCFPDNFKKI
jgi:hypothetical protein